MTEKEKTISEETKSLLDMVENVFTYHAPKGHEIDFYQRIRESAKSFAELLVDLCPHSADLDQSLLKLRECVMFANAAIACNKET